VRHLLPRDRLPRPAAQLAGLLLVVSSSALLSVVLLESAFLVAVPIAGQQHRTVAVTTLFGLSNGAFLRVFPLAPASATYVALGAVILGSDVLEVRFGISAIAIGTAFVAAGLLAVISRTGLPAIIALSAGQQVWIIAAAVGLARSSPPRDVATSCTTRRVG
jgi:hypothetical protein